MSSSSRGSGGTVFVGLLTIAFITLKLIGYISWSWLWVLSPIWIGIAIPTLIIEAIICAALFSGGRR